MSLEKLDETFKRWQALTAELVQLFDEEIAKKGRDYHHSKSKPIDDRVLAKMIRMASEMELHMKNGTKPSTTELVKWSNFLCNPKRY